MQYVDENGEVFTREELIKEIEVLLNCVDFKRPSSISLEISKELDIQSLISIRESLMRKSGNEISQNREWLYGLLDRRT